MKLKYYMRGLGIGILVTTIVLTLGGKKERLSDKEIMARAGKLGMVMAEENDDNLEKVLEKSFDKEDGDILIADNEQGIEDSSDDNDDESNDVEPTDVNSDSEAPDNEASDSEAPDSESNIKLSDDTSVEVPDASEDAIDNEVPDTSGDGIDSEVLDTSDEDTNTGEEDSSEITFTIVRGMSSRQVSELIMQKGLIDDAIDFDNFIKKKGKAGIIIFGTYSLPRDSSYQAILDAIVG